MVQGNTLPPIGNLSKSKKLVVARRGILKTKMNLLRNYRQQKRNANELEKGEVLEAFQDVPNSCEFDVTKAQAVSLDEFKLQLINSVIEKDGLEETLRSNKKNSQFESSEEDTPISVLIKSNEMQMMKTNGFLNNESDSAINGTLAKDDHIEEEIVDEAIRKKIEKQLHIDVTDKYNFVKQTARTKLRPKCTPDFEMNKRFRKNRYRAAKTPMLKKTNLLSENTCGQNHFLGFDKSIKRFKDEKRESDACAKSLVNRSYFNWDSYTVPTHVQNIETPTCQNLTAVGFRDELDFLQYSLVYKKSQSTLDSRLRQRLQLWMKMCKTRKDLQTKSSEKNFYLIENEKCSELNCDRTSELLGCDSKTLMLAVPNGLSCPYLDVDKASVDLWRCRLNQIKEKENKARHSKAFKSEMRNYIKRMILEKQIRCNSTYAAYDISEQNATNLYEDDHDEKHEQDMINETSDNISSCKTSRISYYTSGNNVNVSVNLQTPVKRRMSDLIDSENVSLASSCDQLPQAHIAKIEEMFSDSNDTDEDETCSVSFEINGEASHLRETITEMHSEDRLTELREEIEATQADSSEASSTVEYESKITANLTRDLLISNKAEHNGLISSFLDYGNGQNTKRKKMNKQKLSRRLDSNGLGKTRKRQAQRGTLEWGKFSERDAGDQVLPQQRPRRSDLSLDLSNESNSNSYESMYDIVKTKTRHSLSKSIFNFENCKFPRKDSDVFYTSLLINTSAIPVLALYQKTKRPIPDFMSPYSVLTDRHSPFNKGPKLSLKFNKFTKLQIFVIYVKKLCFVIFKN